jgi:two-component sensor histidine kinase
LTIFAFREIADLDEDAVEERIAQVARSLASNVDREISRAMVTLETLATSLALEKNDLATFHDQARRAISPEQAGILLVDRTLKQLVNTRAPFGTDLPPTSDPETANRVFATAERQVSDAFLGVVSKQHVINIEVPVMHGEGVRYVLIMALDARRFANLLETQGLSNEWMTEIVDRKGVVLARSHEHEASVGRPVDPELLAAKRSSKGVFQAQAAGGERIVGASARSAIADWLISATLPLSVAESSRRRGRLFSIALIGTGLGLGVALAFLFAAHITRPLRAATAAAADVGHGKIVGYTPATLQEANSLTFALSEASSELRRRQEHSEFLLRELAHRSKNQLAVITGMATQTARNASSIQEFVDQFSRRIQGLAKSQELMVERQWTGAPLEALVRGHLDLFGVEKRAEIMGPSVFVDANAAQNLGFALHELATNATKYGALSTSDARLQIHWELTSDGRLHIHWIESGIARSEPPNRQGFGSLVITKLVPQALQGTATTEFSAEGFRWHLDIPDTFVLREA